MRPLLKKANAMNVLQSKFNSDIVMHKREVAALAALAAVNLFGNEERTVVRMDTMLCCLENTDGAIPKWWGR